MEVSGEKTAFEGCDEDGRNEGEPAAAPALEEQQFGSVRRASLPGPGRASRDGADRHPDAAIRIAADDEAGAQFHRAENGNFENEAIAIHPDLGRNPRPPIENAHPS